MGLIDQVESVGEEVESLKKENEALRFMLKLTSSKCKMLEACLRERNLIERHDHMGTASKRARSSSDQFSIVNKTSQFFVKTDSKDNNLVSTTCLPYNLALMFFINLICVKYVLYSEFN